MPKKKNVVAVDLETIESALAVKAAEVANELVVKAPYQMFQYKPIFSSVPGAEGVPVGAESVTVMPVEQAASTYALKKSDIEDAVKKLATPVKAEIGEYANWSIPAPKAKKAKKGKTINVAKLPEKISEIIENNPPKLKTAKKGYVTEARLLALTGKIGYDIKNSVDYAVKDYVKSLEERVAALEEQIKTKVFL